MKSMKLTQVALATTLTLGTTFALADENDKNLVYLGRGSAQTNDPLKSNAVPYSLGYLRLAGEGGGIIGFDLAGEGTLLDSTWGQKNSIKQSTSYNLLLGKNLTKSENVRFDAALLLGVRRYTTSCPSSYLGYQCYANSDPENKYELNYGAMISVTYKSIMFGIRATGESAQALIGIKF